jgi:hypothetical protein
MNRRGPVSTIARVLVTFPEFSHVNNVDPATVQEVSQESIYFSTGFCAVNKCLAFDLLCISKVHIFFSQEVTQGFGLGDPFPSRKMGHLTS